MFIPDRSVTAAKEGKLNRIPFACQLTDYSALETKIVKGCEI